MYHVVNGNRMIKPMKFILLAFGQKFAPRKVRAAIRYYTFDALAILIFTKFSS